MNNKELASIAEYQQGYDSENYDAICLPRYIFEAMLGRLKGEQQVEWIDILDRYPSFRAGELLEFKSVIGTWVERFDRDKGAGIATHWRPL